MLIIHFIEGILVGFVLATPVGPIGILCVRHTLAFGRSHGLVVGLGGATADILYATVAAFGVKLISAFVSGHHQLIQAVGGVFLLIVGLYTLLSSAKVSVKTVSLALHTKVFASTFLLAITNPMTLVGFAAVFTMLGVRRMLPEQTNVLALVAGVFIGSLLWFSVLASLARKFREQLTTGGLARVNRIAGSFLMLLGAIAVLRGAGIF